ncbi:MAG: YkgJ family cysteine cluster protein [Planctomycetota bacterium]|nr:MAG: YkgJ family cysteine cluster protein [Planctomycetota bacterium]
MGMMTTSTIRTRDQVPAGECLCEYCTAKCCRYFALPIDPPESVRDFDFIRWFLLHERATIFVEDESWYLLVHTVCKHLQPDNRCGIYDTRPEICREYSTDNCEFDDDATYDAYFETAEQVAEFMEATVLQSEIGCVRSAEPPILPVAH